MTENADNRDGREPDFFDQLVQGGGSAPREQASFTQAFRGYDKGEVDAAVATLRAQLQRAETDVALARNGASGEADAVRAEAEAAQAEAAERIAELEAAAAAAQAQAAELEQQVATLTSELVEAPKKDGDDEGSRLQFEAVLRVAEEQATVLIQNAATQAERLLEAAREEAESKRAELAADVARITAEAQSEADQVRLRIDTEYTAHEARIAREGAHAAEKVTQAEQEAAAVRAEAEKGSAALRSMVTRETQQQRADAEREVREMNTRVLEFEESLTRRQNDAQQEFLTLHNQAVAHAERITSDANEQVQSSLEHAQRISAKADDYERLMRSQAQTIESDAQVRARETLDRARVKAQRIVETVIGHTTEVLRDAEDRTRQLRWQQQQLNSFMAEVRELIRPDGVLTAEPTDADAADEDELVEAVDVAEELEPAEKD
ncbi:DivIVA domain-containing protein [Microbacterium sp. ZKA21]|uniref:DivIVA domain-containing protein n=1 Tax=Microbacterium sp. ZKA21 TaxID=3381694 RepID=UPI003D2608A5